MPGIGDIVELIAGLGLLWGFLWLFRPSRHRQPFRW